MHLLPFISVDMFGSPSPDIFISHQWYSKPEVLEVKKELLKNHISCWMDVDQIYGSSLLHKRIAEGIKNPEVKLEDFCQNFFSAGKIGQNYLKFPQSNKCHSMQNKKTCTWKGGSQVAQLDHYM